MPEDTQGGPAATESTPTAPSADIPHEQWSAAVPETHKADKYWEPLKGKPLSEVLRGYGEAQKYQGTSVRIPGKDAKPEEVDAFYAKLGRPAKAEEYGGAVKLATMPEGLEFQPEMLAEAYSVFHKAGLSPAQAQAMLDHYATLALRTRDVATQEAGQANAQVQAELKAELEKAWGPEGSPAYKNGVNAARAFIRQMAVESGLPTEKVARLESLGLTPEFVQVFATAGKMFAGEHGMVLSDVGPMPSRDEALAEIAAIRRDRSHPFNTGGPGFAKAKEHVDSLYRLVYGTAEMSSR